MNQAGPTVTLGIDGHHPALDTQSWAAPGSCLIGRVHLAAGSSVWYNSVLRADNEAITVGENTNIQDGCVLHADPGFPITLGRGITVGHRAILHGCTVEDDCLIGMGAIVLNGAVIGSGTLVAAGTVILEGSKIPPGSLVAGVPGKVRRDAGDQEKTHIHVAADTYVSNAARHRGALD
jgi:carbonic anhydrase/acetyltransferase-like protein (isoleucine patch superfamily)